ncbi:helix-turn-helix domain-containing protein [Sphingobacterium corticibacterium]|uniref:XRE family transcriptional regulator n=1 Tax=Sphingobacterium corticibacterium TaxID=2484746 RepID=A0A4Q6XRX5_9SPHI|nr:helix-turn-helix transcriptional regulator [Sphingobacterium corticibacterium]RZF60252.1 XRE family transcriptional regulator [Sphingobacterium corticibacterium]
MSKDYSKIKADFGTHIRKLRDTKNYSLRKVASQCDLDDSNISKIENGKFNIQLSTIIELAKGLEVHPSKLLDYDFGSDII